MATKNLSPREEEIDRVTESVRAYIPRNLGTEDSQAFDFLLRNLVEDILTARNEGRDISRASLEAMRSFEGGIEDNDIPLEIAAKTLTDQVVAAITTPARKR